MGEELLILPSRVGKSRARSEITGDAHQLDVAALTPTASPNNDLPGCPVVHGRLESKGHAKTCTIQSDSFGKARCLASASLGACQQISGKPGRGMARQMFASSNTLTEAVVRAAEMLMCEIASIFHAFSWTSP